MTSGKTNLRNTKLIARRVLRGRLLAATVVVTGVLMGCSTILGLCQMRRQYFLTSRRPPDFEVQSHFHPTTVPFKPTQKACEESGRQWKDDQCIDEEHDPIF